MTSQKSKKIPVKPVIGSEKTGKNTAEENFAANDKPNISDIYEENRDSNVDMTRLDRKSNKKGKIILVFVAVFLVMLACASLAGFFIFSKKNSGRGESVKLSIKAPKTVSSGEEIAIELTYLNTDKVALKDVDLTILYPDGFYFASAEPQAQNDAHTYWKLGKIASGEGGKLKIYGQIIGDINATKTFSVSVNYSPTNFNSVFEEKIAHSLEITSSIVNLTISAPLRIVSGQETEIRINYKNNSKLPLSDLKISTVYPEGYGMKESNPKPLDDGKTWNIKTLAPKEEGVIILKGTFQGEVGSVKQVVVQLGLSQSGEFRLQSEKSVLINLVKPELNLQLSVNGGNQELISDLGQAMEFKVEYKNASEVELKNVVLNANFVSDADILDFSKINDPSAGKAENKTITWSGTEIPALASVVPGAEGSFMFSMPLAAIITAKKETDRNYSVDCYIKVANMDTDEIKSNFEKMSESNHVKIKVNSKVSLSAEGRYYSEEFEKLGTGPIPPEVGKTTSYLIYWNVSNMYNDLENMEVITILPTDVSWTGNATSNLSGSVTFDPITRKVSWKIADLSANTGQILPIAEASFEVSITPNIKQAGRLMVLANESLLSAKDSYTNAELSATDRLITTDLENDIAVQGRGIVVQSNSNANNPLSNGNINSGNINAN